MSNRRDIQFLYNPHNKATLIDCKFTVASTDAAGVGITGLNKGGRIANVFMNTSAAFTGTSHTSVLIDSIASTASLAVGMPVQGSGIAAGTTIASIVSATSINLSAATSSSTTGSITYQAVGNINPAAGYAIIQLQDNYNRYLGGFNAVVSPVTGSALTINSGTPLTVGVPYVIVTLGTTTTVQWHTVGVPLGTTPAIGVAFFAAATSGSGNGTVKALGSSGIVAVEVIGNSNLSIVSNGAQLIGGAGVSPPYIIVQFLGAAFTGSALAAHSHALLLKDAAVVDGATTRVNAGTNLLGANTGSNITVAGGGANGGVQTASAGTPAGTISLAPAAPANGSLIHMAFYLNNSAQGV